MGAHASGTGSQTTVLGYGAAAGQASIALGFTAGRNSSGSQDIYIGNQGTSENQTIRIGTGSAQTRSFLAGVSGVPLTGAVVVVNSSGQLGVEVSSARFKRKIRDMGVASGGLTKLRPVTFFYRNDPEESRQFGLVAEEVEKVYPELVVHGDNGVESVRYSMLAPMLLNELQKQGAENARQAAQLNRLSSQLAQITAKLMTLETKLTLNGSTAGRLTITRQGE